MATDKFGVEVTPERWEQVDVAVRAFIRTYPLHWTAFQNDLKANRTKYQLALEGDLKKSSWRNTLSFPIVARAQTEAERAEDPTHSKVQFVASLKDDLEKLIPGFTAPDEAGAPNKLYKEFIRRYGRLFVPGEVV
jgi:hypothetical protein